MSNQNNCASPLPWFFIGRQMTEERIENFKARRYPAICTALGKPDTLSVWYSFEHIERLYKEMILANASGLRIHFGAYNSDHPDMADQTCLVMTLTQLNTQTNEHKRFWVEDAVEFNARVAASSSNRDFDPDMTDRDFNLGNPCPPFCPDGDN